MPLIGLDRGQGESVLAHGVASRRRLCLSVRSDASGWSRRTEDDQSAGQCSALRRLVDTVTGTRPLLVETPPAPLLRQHRVWVSIGSTRPVRCPRSRRDLRVQACGHARTGAVTDRGPDEVVAVGRGCSARTCRVAPAARAVPMAWARRPPRPTPTQQRAAQPRRAFARAAVGVGRGRAGR